MRISLAAGFPAYDGLHMVREGSGWKSALDTNNESNQFWHSHFWQKDVCGLGVEGCLSQVNSCHYSTSEEHGWIDVDLSFAPKIIKNTRFTKV